MIKNWSITVDYVDGNWEASVDGTSDPVHLHVDDGWESRDVHTLMAAIGRDLAEEVNPLGRNG
jgi:hypothetical protein